MKILVNSSIKNVDRIGMTRNIKTYTARMRKGWRHAVSKFRSAVSMEIAEEKR